MCGDHLPSTRRVHHRYVVASSNGDEHAKSNVTEIVEGRLLCVLKHTSHELELGALSSHLVSTESRIR